MSLGGLSSAEMGRCPHNPQQSTKQTSRSIQLTFPFICFISFHKEEEKVGWEKKKWSRTPHAHSFIHSFDAGPNPQQRMSERELRQPTTKRVIVWLMKEWVNGASSSLFWLVAVRLLPPITNPKDSSLGPPLKRRCGSHACLSALFFRWIGQAKKILK